MKILASALAPYHPKLRDLPPELPFVRDAATLRNGTVFTLDTDAGTIYLLAEISGVGTDADVKANSVIRQAWGREVRVLNLQGLLKAKRAAGRPKDLQMIPELEALLELEASGE